MTDSAITSPVETSLSAIGFNLAAIGLMLAVVGLGLAYWLDAGGRSSQPLPRLDDDTNILSRTLSGHALAIPAAWFRSGEQAEEEFSSEIALRIAVDFPTYDAHRPTTHLIDMTLVPRSRARVSANLLDGVYLHQFAPEQVSAPPGLIGKRLRDSDGFSGETVWYDPISPTPFAVKCLDAIESEGPPRCLRTVALTQDITAVFAFDSDVLVSWRQFDASLSPWLKRLGLETAVKN